MKQNWTRLLRMIQSLEFNAGHLDGRFRTLFLRHHQNADEIVLNKAGEPLAAVYFHPMGRHQEEFKSLMRAVRDRVEYDCDQTKMPCPRND